jgi:hypothetical protein
VGKDDVDAQTCDLNAGVPVRTRVGGGTSGMLNIHAGGPRRKSEKFEELLKKFNKDPPGGGAQKIAEISKNRTLNKTRVGSGHKTLTTKKFGTGMTICW